MQRVQMRAGETAQMVTATAHSPHDLSSNPKRGVGDRREMTPEKYRCSLAFGPGLQ